MFSCVVWCGVVWCGVCVFVASSLRHCCAGAGGAAGAGAGSAAGASGGEDCGGSSHGDAADAPVARLGLPPGPVLNGPLTPMTVVLEPSTVLETRGAELRALAVAGPPVEVYKHFQQLSAPAARHHAAAFMLLIQRCIRSLRTCGARCTAVAVHNGAVVPADAGSASLEHVVACVYADTRRHAVPLDLNTYLSVLEFVGTHPTVGVDAALAVLEDVRRAGLSLTSTLYEAAIDVHVAHGRTADALPLVQGLHERFSVPKSLVQRLVAAMEADTAAQGRDSSRTALLDFLETTVQDDLVRTMKALGSRKLPDVFNPAAGAPFDHLDDPVGVVSDMAFHLEAWPDSSDSDGHSDSDSGSYSDSGSDSDSDHDSDSESEFDRPRFMAGAIIQVDPTQDAEDVISMIPVFSSPAAPDAGLGLGLSSDASSLPELPVAVSELVPDRVTGAPPPTPQPFVFAFSDDDGDVRDPPK